MSSLSDVTSPATLRCKWRCEYIGLFPDEIGLFLDEFGRIFLECGCVSDGATSGALHLQVEV